MTVKELKLTRKNKQPLHLKNINIFLTLSV